MNNRNNPLFKKLYQKRIGFSPLLFCEFFQGMDVLQIYGEESKEYFFAIYFSGNLVGHIYFGEKFSNTDLARIIEKYFPPTWDQIYDYVKNNSGVWYYKFDSTQYAYVLQEPNILQCVEK